MTKTPRNITRKGQDLVGEKVHSTFLKSDSYYYNIRQIIRGLGSDIFHASHFFYSFTGCDTFSSFCVKGKCKAYDIWVKSERKDDFFDDVFVELAEKPTDVISDHIDMLTLAAARLDRYKSPQIMTCTYYHQARKLHTNIFMVLLIKLGICGEGVLKN